MPKALIDRLAIYYESHGEGFPLVLCHEFAGDHRSWDQQVGYFSRRYQVITYNARGYPPSDVPDDPEAYNQERSVEDLKDLMDHLGVERAHIGGLSMGGAVALHFGLMYPNMARSLIVAGAGTGSVDPGSFRQTAIKFAQQMETHGMQSMSDYAKGPTRIQLLAKDPMGWERFASQFLSHSSTGSAFTFRGFQAKRAPVFDHEMELRALDVPTLIMFGDEDEPCIEPGVFMKRTIPRSGLSVFPKSGHAINLEEPDLFNRTIADFLSAVEIDRWPERAGGVDAGRLA